MKFIAHRGESLDAPENTLAAFQLAWDRGIDTVELDVHVSADGDLIVCHDHDTLRTTGVPLAIGETPTRVLRELDAGRWRGDEWAGEKLPLLEEVLERLTGARRAFVEIKDKTPDTIGRCVWRLKASLEASGKSAGAVTVMSFYPDAIAKTRRLLPEIETAFLFRIDVRDPEVDERWDEAVRKAKDAGANGLSMGYFGDAFLTGIPRARQAGLNAYVWTVDDRETARAVAAQNPDAIISNNAAHLASHGTQPG